MSPWLKTLLVISVGAIASLASAAIGGSPPPQVAAFLASHPWVIGVVSAIVYAAHNYLSEVAPPDPMKAKI